MMRQSFAMDFLWMIPAGCNYECPYCSFRAYRKGRVGSPAGASFDDWVEGWRRVHDAYGTSQILISGSGEPTLFPGFHEFLSIVSAWHRITFDTNLSWREADVRRFVAEIDPARVKVHASFHPLNASAEEFVKKLSLLRDNGFDYQCRWVAYPPLLGKLGEYRRFFRGRALRFAVTPYEGPWDGLEYPGGYTAGQKQRFVDIEREDHGESEGPIINLLCERHVGRPMGKACLSGVRHACVVSNGRIYRCLEYARQNWASLASIFDGPLPFAAPEPLCRSSMCGVERQWLT